ncbi:hypothetical protein, partial [Scytonema sp. UIC 10036]|uniref:hypothetical protein n=1 Tax=Scytonema sp. UIC 10036 TaxID=2304196 RepID=UPI00140F7DA2
AKPRECSRENPEYKISYFSFSGSFLIFKNLDKSSNLKRSEIFEEDFTDKITIALVNLAHEEKFVVAPFLQLVMIKLWEMAEKEQQESKKNIIY